ncbi:MAG: pseudouridine synthase, partial [Desulfurococcales archaeon ex4484_58]
MIKRKPSRRELIELRRIADLQFRGVGEKLIPDNIFIVVSASTQKIRYLLLENKVYLSLRAGDHRFILHILSGRRLNEILPHPYMRVYINPNYSEFIKRGGNVFTKHVVLSDPDIRPGDEVLVLDSSTKELLAVGKAVKPGWSIPYHSWGEAVRVREGIG